MATCAFIGLGNMGYPMAGHLATAGHTVGVFNRTGATASRWVGEHEGSRHDTPGGAAEGAEVAFVCVGNDDDVRSVVLGEGGALAAMAEGSVLVASSTRPAGPGGSASSTPRSPAVRPGPRAAS